MAAIYSSYIKPGRCLTAIFGILLSQQFGLAAVAGQGEFRSSLIDGVPAPESAQLRSSDFDLSRGRTHEPITSGHIGNVKPPKSVEVATDSKRELPPSETSSIDTVHSPKGMQAGETSVGIASRAGYTSNAGPTLDPIASPVFETVVEFSHARAIENRQLSLSGLVNGREFLKASETRTLTYNLSASLAPADGDTHKLTPSVAVIKTAEVDEELTQVVAVFEYIHDGSEVKPFITSTAAYLDYADIPALFLEFGNQDDRDRFSITEEAGVAYQPTKPLHLKFGFGADLKLYSDKTDDFGFDRDSRSAFAFASAAYKLDKGAMTLRYSPVYRVYADDNFGSLLIHTISASAEYAPEEAWKISAGVRYGLSETDFLTARAVTEFAVQAGAKYTFAPETTASFDAVYTIKDHDGYERIDRKLEITGDVRAPLAGDLSLSAKVEYLNFETTLLGLKTDMVLAMAGIVYAFGK